MSIIQAQKIPVKPVKPEDTIAKFCYYFPQYTFNQAKQIPYKRILQMLTVVFKEQARFKLDLVNIVAAPHTKKGKGVKTLVQYFKDIIED